MNFSVSMCVYGKDNPIYFKLAVDSILNQTIKPTEVVLVVDGPIPNSLNEIVRQYELLPFFKIIRLEKNQGHAIARQTGLNACSNELVAIMDADDLSLSNRFEKQLKIFEDEKDVSVVGGLIHEFIEEPTNVVGTRVVPQSDEDIKHYMKSRCPMNLVTVMMKKSHLQAVGGYIDWYCEEDYYLWVRLAIAQYKFYNIQENLVNVRVGKEMYQRRGGWRYFKSEARLQGFMLKKHIINIFRYLYNVLGRFCVQVLMPNKLRGFIFQKMFRQSK